MDSLLSTWQRKCFKKILFSAFCSYSLTIYNIACTFHFPFLTNRNLFPLHPPFPFAAMYLQADTLPFFPSEIMFQWIYYLTSVFFPCCNLNPNRVENLYENGWASAKWCQRFIHVSFRTIPHMKFNIYFAGKRIMMESSSSSWPMEQISPWPQKIYSHLLQSRKLSYENVF